LMTSTIYSEISFVEPNLDPYVTKTFVMREMNRLCILTVVPNQFRNIS